MSDWKDETKVVICIDCGYPHEQTSCPNPGCITNLSVERRAELAARAACDAEWTANFRRFIDEVVGRRTAHETLTLDDAG